MTETQSKEPETGPEKLETAVTVSNFAISGATAKTGSAGVKFAVNDHAIINAAGFLALSFSSFPPLRQFGLVTSAAFVLALIADFTALPAGLWMIERRKRRQAGWERQPS